MPIPQTKLLELSKVILELLDKDQPLHYSLSEFESNRVLSLINELRQYSPAYAYSFKGCLHGVKGNNAEAEKEHKKALTFAPNDTIIITNYGATLLRMSRYMEAEQAYLKALEIDPEDPKIIRGAITAAYYADDFSRLPSLLHKHEKLTGSVHPVTYWVEEDVEDEAEMPAILAEAEQKGCVGLEQLKKELGL